MLGKTQKSTEVVSDATCNACEMAVTWMQSEFVQNHTKEGKLEYANQVWLYEVLLFLFIEQF